MKKIMGLMAILMTAGALAAPAMAECRGYYDSHVIVRREVPIRRHEIRRDVRFDRDFRR